MGGLDRPLGDGVRHQEEIELPVFHLTLLDEASVDVSSLRGVLDELITLGSLSLLEESLSDALVHNDQGNLRRLDGSRLGLFLLLLLLLRGFSGASGVFGVGSVFLGLEDAVLFGDDLVELVEFLVDDHLSHGITDTITVDEDVLGHGSIEVAVTLEGTLEVVGEDAGGNNFLSLLRLRSGLGIVFAEVGIVRGAESDGTLFTLVAHVDSNQHGGR